MVIGNGMIATAFGSYQSKDEFIIFASGVSDSTHSLKAAFAREKKLLEDTLENYPGRTLVYFSTCSIYDPSIKGSPYIKHKLEIEALIMQHQPSYVIFRLSNPVGETHNTKTIVNYLINNIQEKKSFSLWKHASRNVIDMDDVYHICDEILEKKLFLNSIVNIANPRNYPVSFIVKTIEKHVDIQATYNLAEKGDSPNIDVSAIEPIFKKINTNFEQDYLPNLLQKYFPK